MALRYYGVCLHMGQSLFLSIWHCHGAVGVVVSSMRTCKKLYSSTRTIQIHLFCWRDWFVCSMVV